MQLLFIREAIMRRQLKHAVTALIALAVFSFPPVGFSQTPTAVWTPDLEMKVRAIGVVRASPDGKNVAYTISSAVMTPEKSDYVTQIWVVNTDGGNANQLTFAEKSSENPKWSPDGKSLAFTSSRSGKSNLYLIRLGGGEAEQL